MATPTTGQLNSAQGITLAYFAAAAGGNLTNLANIAATSSITLAQDLQAVATLATGTNFADNTTFINTILKNLLITSSNSAYTAAQAWLTDQIVTQGLDKGATVATAVNYLLGLTDTTNQFYSIASAFQTRTANAVTWSQSTAGAATLSVTALQAYQSSVDNYVAPPPPVVTTVLTTSATDSLTGNGTATTFTGTYTNLASTDTLQATDKIDGVSGSNILQISLGANWGGFTTGSVKNVQTIQLTNSGTSNLTWDGTGTSGVTSYSLTNTTGTISLSNVATGFNNLSITGSNGTALTTITTGFIAGASELTTAGTLALTLNSVGTASTSSTPKELNVNPSNFKTINVVSNGTNYVSFDSTSASLTAITASGSGALTVTHVPAKVTSFDASALTGALVAGFGQTDATSTVATFAPLTTIKLGSGGSTVTGYVGTGTDTVTGITGNATISATGGTNKLTLIANAASANQFTMSGIQTVDLQTGGSVLAQTFSGTNVTGLTTITEDGADKISTSTLQFANMGTGNFTINATSTKATSGLLQGATLSIDNSGSDTLNLSALAADVTNQTQESATDVYTFSNATSLTVNVNPQINYLTGTITANKATTLTVTVADGESTANAQQTIWNTAITANLLNSFAINSSGTASGTLNSSLAASGTITNGAFAGTMTINTPKLTSLTTTSGNDLTLTASTFSNLQSLTSTQTKGTLSLPALPWANSINLTGTGSSTAASILALGTASTGTTSSTIGQQYDLSVVASGFAGGLTLTTLDASIGNNITIDGSALTGNLTVGQIGSSTAADYVNNITVKDYASGKTMTLSGAVSGTGTVIIDGTGTSSTSITGAITGNNVTLVMTGSNTNIPSLITAKASANITYPLLNTSSLSSTITIGTGATSSVVTLAGTLGSDAITINTVSTQTSIVVKGDLNLGTNTLALNDTATTATAQTIDVSGLANTTVTITTGNSKSNDTILLSNGSDVVHASWGQDTFTGGTGADTYWFENGQSTYSAPDTITNFTKAKGDTITYGATAVLALTPTFNLTAAVSQIKVANAVNTNANTVTLTPNGYGFVTFSGTASDFATLAQDVQILHAYAAANSGVAGDYALFSFSGSTYLWIDSNTNTTAGSAATDTVIKLVGVNAPTTLPTLSASGASAPSGITGFGA